MVVDINEVQIGQKLIAVEVLSGRELALMGPVTLIDHERKEIAIKVRRDNRSFPINVLGYDPRDAKLTMVSSAPKNEKRILLGFIRSLLEGSVDQSNLNSILEEIREKGIQPTRLQEALELLF